MAVSVGTTTKGIDFVLLAGGSIAGRVVDDSGNGVASAGVYAGLYDCCGGQDARADGDGYYEIRGLAAGTYRVEAFAPQRGLVSQFYSSTRRWSEATPVSVSSGTTTPDIDFVLVAGGGISGIVTRQSDGTPVINADVWANSYDGGGGGSGARTDVSGRYAISGIGAGDYRVQVSPSRTQDPDLSGEFFSSTTSWDDAARVTVVAGTTTRDIDFKLAAGGSISGRVVKASGGQGVDRAFVWAELYNCCGGNGAETDSDGYFTIVGLPAGDYRVQAHGREGSGLVSQFYSSTSQWSQATPVSVVAGTTTPNVNFSLTGGGSISGKVVLADSGDPVVNAEVRANTFACCGGGGGTRTDINGEYTVSGLAAGTYIVEALHPKLGLAKQYYSSTSSFSQATSVTVAVGTTTVNINFALTAGGSISGRVIRESDGTAVANADVWAGEYDCCGGNGVRTDSNGDYIIRGLAGGDYRVQASVPSDPGLVMEFFSSTLDWQNAARVTVTAGTTTAGIDFSLIAGGSISGRVVTAAGGTPVSGAHVHAGSYSEGGGGNGAETKSDGYYTIPGLAAGTYRVEVDASHLGLARQFYSSTSDWDQATPVTVNVGTTTMGIDFALVEGGSISGVVTNVSGTPIVGANVDANPYDDGGGGGGDRTATDGSYTIAGLIPGDYRVEVRAVGYALQFYSSTSVWEDAARVTVTAGTTTAGIDFSLVIGGSISGAVHEADGTTPIVGLHVHADPYDDSGGGNGAETKSDGTYSITSLSAGDYRVRAEGAELGFIPEFYSSTIIFQSSTKVVVAAGADTPNIDFTLEVGGTIAGVVTNASGTPIAGAHVRADPDECCGQGEGAKSKADGRYKIKGLATDDYRVRAMGDGYARQFYSSTDRRPYPRASRSPPAPQRRTSTSSWAREAPSRARFMRPTARHQSPLLSFVLGSTTLPVPSTAPRLSRMGLT